MPTASQLFTYTGSPQSFAIPRHKPGTLRVTVDNGGSTAFLAALEG